VVRVLVGLEHNGGYKGEVCPARLLVDGTLVHLGVDATRAVNGVDMDDRHKLEEHLGLGLDELCSALVPAGTLQVETVDIDALRGRLRDVVLHGACHLIVQDHRIQGPALVGSGHLLNDMVTRYEAFIEKIYGKWEQFFVC